MCQVSCGQCELFNQCSEAVIDFVEGLFEAGWGGTVAWQGCSETWPKKTIVGSGEEQRGAESGIGDMVALGVWEAFDHAVETQTAELIGHTPLGEIIEGMSGRPGTDSRSAGKGRLADNIRVADTLWSEGIFLTLGGQQ